MPQAKQMDSEPAVVGSSKDPVFPRGDELWLRNGQRVEHFKIKRLLGRGGMSQVYLARDLRLGRNVALKIIHPDLLGSWETVKAFLQEARATAKFNHPNIVHIYAVGEYEGCPYVALEFLEGQSLRQRLLESEIPQNEVVRLGVSIAEALEEAHRSHVLHCDLKPENILLPHDGRLRVVDFGLARVLSGQGRVPTSEPELEEATEEQASLVTQIRGTPAYMAPEQWVRGARLSSATDVWALGVTLFEMLSGVRPFRAEVLQELREEICRLSPLPAMPGRVPQELRQLVEACLHRIPEKRIKLPDLLESLRTMLSARAPTVREDEEPFLGLQPFREGQAHLFFGRGREINAFLEKLRRYPVLPVIGPSGAGKSSFVFAGIVPRLIEQGRWLVLRIRPQREPFLVMAQRLWAWLAPASTSTSMYSIDLDETKAHLDAEQRLAARLFEEPRLLSILLHRIAEHHHKHVLLVVDQLEELLTLVEDIQLRHRYVESLYGAAEDAADPVRLIFTLRDDYLGRFADTPEAQSLLSHVTLLRTPDAESLHDILVRPVEALGYRYPSEAFVSRMIREVEGEPAGLPLLQFACQILWERRDHTHKVLKADVYDEIGGVGGALSEHADSVIRQLPVPQLPAAREIFLRLVTSERTRRVATYKEVMDGLAQDGERALNALVQARLLVVHQTVEEGKASQTTRVEIVHESLVQRWAMLHHWIDESHGEQAFLQEIRQAADLWERRGQRSAEVWEGDALQEAMAFQERYALNLPNGVLRFLEAGRSLARRKRKFRQFVLAGVSVATLVILVLSLLASLILQQKNNEISKRWALAQQLATRNALMRGEHLSAYAHLRAALEHRDSPALRAFWRRLQRAPLLWQRHLNTALEDVRFLPSPSTRLVVSGRRGGLFLLDVRTGKKWLLRGHRGHVLCLAVSQGGDWLASGDWSGNIFLWRKQDVGFSLVRSWKAHPSPVQSLAFHPKEAVLVSAAYDGVRLWQWKTQKEIRWDAVHSWKQKRRVKWRQIGERPIQDLSFRGDGQWLALAGYNVVFLIHWPSRRIRWLRMISGRIEALSFSSNQKWLVAVGRDRKMALLDLASWSLKRFEHGHVNNVTAMALDSKGKWLATAGFDNTIRLWRMPSMKLHRVFRGHSNVVKRLAFDPQSQLLASVSGDQTLRVWRLQEEWERWRGQSHDARVTSLSFGPLGKVIASGGADHTIRLWDSQTGAHLLRMEGHSNAVRSIKVSPDGMRLVSSGYDNTTRIWRVGRSYRLPGSWWGREIHRFRSYNMPRFKSPFSTQGNQMLMMRGSLLYVWNLFSFQRSMHWDAGVQVNVPAKRARRAQLIDAAFHPNGRWVASADYLPSIKLWRLQDHKVIRTFQTPEVPLEVHIGPLGRYMVSAGRSPRAYLWDLRSMGTGQDHSPKVPEAPVPPSRVLRGHKGYISSVAFDPTERHLVTGSMDGSVRLWSLEKGTYKELAKPKRRSFYHVAYRPDGEQVAAVSSEHRIFLWDLPSGRLRHLPGHPGGVTALKFSADSKMLASSGNDGTVRVWLSQDARPLWRTAALLPSKGLLLTHKGWQSLRNPRRPTTSPNLKKRRWMKVLLEQAWTSEVSSNGRFLAIQTGLEHLELWDLKSDQKLGTHQLPGLQQWWVNSQGMAWVLAKGALWRLQGKRKSQMLEKPLLSAFAMQGELLWFASATHLWKLDTQARQPKPVRWKALDGPVSAMRALGAMLGVGYKSGQFVWFPISTQDHKGFQESFYDLPLSAITKILPGPHNTIVLGFQNGTIGIWSRSSGRPLESIRLHGSVKHLRIRQHSLIAATDLGESIVWNISSYQLPRCKLLRDVWKHVAVVWDSGRVVSKPMPQRHPCLGKTAKIQN